MKSLISVAGRMNRRQYWLIWLGTVAFQLLSITLIFLSGELEQIVAMINILAGIFLMLQSVKRVHDTDHSGWYVLIPFYNLILLLSPGTFGPNRYGADPNRAVQGYGADMNDVLDGDLIESNKSTADDTQRALIYLIVYLCYGYAQGIIYHFIFPFLSHDGFGQHQAITLVFGLIRLIMLCYMLVTVRHDLVKTVLTIIGAIVLYYFIGDCIDFLKQGDFLPQ